MLLDVWEVYGESHTCIACKTEEFARHQNIIVPNDGIHQAKINMTKEEIRELNETGYIWLWS